MVYRHTDEPITQRITDGWTILTEQLYKYLLYSVLSILKISKMRQRNTVYHILILLCGSCKGRCFHTFTFFALNAFTL